MSGVDEPGAVGSPKVVKRSIVIAGHRTSVSMEEAFWAALKRIAASDGISLAALVAQVDAARGEANLSSSLRVYALERTLALQEYAMRGAANLKIEKIRDRPPNLIQNVINPADQLVSMVHPKNNTYKPK